MMMAKSRALHEGRNPSTPRSASMPRIAAPHYPARSAPTQHPMGRYAPAPVRPRSLSRQPPPREGRPVPPLLLHQLQQHPRRGTSPALHNRPTQPQPPQRRMYQPQIAERPRLQGRHLDDQPPYRPHHHGYSRPHTPTMPSTAPSGKKKGMAMSQQELMALHSDYATVRPRQALDSRRLASRHIGSKSVDSRNERPSKRGTPTKGREQHGLVNTKTGTMRRKLKKAGVAGKSRSVTPSKTTKGELVVRKRLVRQQKRMEKPRPFTAESNPYDKYSPTLEELMKVSKDSPYKQQPTDSNKSSGKQRQRRRQSYPNGDTLDVMETAFDWTMKLLGDEEETLGTMYSSGEESARHKKAQGRRSRSRTKRHTTGEDQSSSRSRSRSGSLSSTSQSMRHTESLSVESHSFATRSRTTSMDDTATIETEMSRMKRPSAVGKGHSRKQSVDISLMSMDDMATIETEVSRIKRPAVRKGHSRKESVDAISEEGSVWDRMGLSTKRTNDSSLSGKSFKIVHWTLPETHQDATTVTVVTVESESDHDDDDGVELFHPPSLAGAADHCRHGRGIVDDDSVSDASQSISGRKVRAKDRRGVDTTGSTSLSLGSFFSWLVPTLAPPSSVTYLGNGAD